MINYIHIRLLIIFITVFISHTRCLIYEPPEVPQQTRQQWHEPDAFQQQQQQQSSWNYPGLSKQLCGHPESHPNSGNNVSQLWVPPGTIAVYTCDPGYFHVKGNLYRVCQIDQTWSGQAIQCARKVSVGKEMSCENKAMVKNEEMLFLVDGDERTCAKINTAISQDSSSATNKDFNLVWREDLMQNYNSITLFRLVFHGDINSLSIMKIYLEGPNQSPRTLFSSDCVTNKRQLGTSNFHEVSIMPNEVQKGRYVTFYFRVRANKDKFIEFCEAEVYDVNTAGVYQCFGEKTMPNSQVIENYLQKTTVIGEWCYTFVDKESSWAMANRECSLINGGLLVTDVSNAINQSLTSFAKANHIQSQFWMGGKTVRNNAPDTSRGYTIDWVWNSQKLVDKLLVSSENVNENECLSFSAPSGVWLNSECSHITGLICQTAIKRCSHPPLGKNVIAVDVQSLAVGSRLRYRCPEGFIMTGDETQQCMANGQWSGQSPHCLGKDDYAKYQAHNSKLPDEAIIGIIVAAVIVGLVLIAVLVAVIVASKRGGRFKKKIYFHKGPAGESVDTLDESKGDTLQLNKDKKEKYDSMKQHECVQEETICEEQQHQQQAL